MFSGSICYEMVLLPCVRVDKESWHPLIDSSLKLFRMGILARDSFIFMWRLALNKVRYILIILQIQVHKIIVQMLIVYGLWEEKIDLLFRVIDKWWLFGPIDCQLLLLVDFGLFNNVMISLSEFICNIGSKDVLFKLNYNFARIVGGVSGWRDFSYRPHGLVIIL